MTIWDGIFGRRRVKLTEPGWHIESGTWAEKATHPDAVLQLATAWACVRLNAGVMSSLPLTLFRKDQVGVSAEADDHPLFSLLQESPNADQSAMEFWEGQYVALQLRGNAFAEKVFNGAGVLSALMPMHPDITSVYRASDGSRRYRYTDPFGNANDWGEDKVFHLRGFGAGGMTGLSPIHYGRQTMASSLAADEVAGRTFANGLQLSGFAVDQPNAKTSQEQRFELIELFEKFAGSKRAGKVMPLPPGFDFKALGLSPEDAQLLETRGFHVEEICRWFGVFPILIGHAGAGQTMWGSGVEQINLAWLTLYLGRELRRIEQAICKQLLTPAERVSLYVRHNVDDLLRADSVGRAALYSSAGQNGWMDRNEIRAKENRPPRPGGDQLTVQSNLVPLEKLGEMGGQPTPPGFNQPDAPKQPAPAPPPQQPSKGK